MAFIIADASPLIGLDRAGHLDLLPGLFGTLAAPPAVLSEFGRQPAWLASITVQHPDHVSLLRALSFGAGEAEALTVAMERPGSTLLLDEKQARRLAQERGIALIGTAGIVLRAKRAQLISAARPVLDDLITSGFHLSDALYRGVMELADEA